MHIATTSSSDHQMQVRFFGLILWIAAVIFVANSVSIGATGQSARERRMNAERQLREYRQSAQKEKLLKSSIRSISSAPAEVGIQINAAAKTSSTIFFYDNFESGAHTWTTELNNGSTDDLWHSTTLNSSSVTHSWWPGIELQSNYNTGRRISTSMKSEAIDLTAAAGPVTLLFAENYRTERGWDYCMVDVSSNGGANWTPLRGAYGAAPSGNSEGWKITILDLTSYAGQNITLRFFLDTGDSLHNNFPGWFVDDIVIFDQSGVITGKKFFDVNNNGVKDVGERGVKDWLVTATGPVTFTTKTNYRGRYRMTLPLGSYTITETQQVNWTQKYPLSGDWNINLSTPDTLIDSLHFGNYTQASFINGIKFHDLNQNHVFDGGDTVLPEWKVVLSDSDTNPIDYDYTDSLGQFQLYVFAPGRYIVSEIGRQNWIQSAPDTENYYVDIPDLNTTVNGIDFGNYYVPTPTNSILGMKFNDRNRNHSMDPGEEGLAGFKIQLNGPFSGQTTTDSSGFYQFNNLPPDAYTIRELPREGWWQSFPDSFHTLALNSGETLDSVDFGNYQIEPGLIGGTKFRDANANASRDSSEDGLGGWRIELNGTTYTNRLISEEAITGGNGSYSFPAVWPGTYNVSEVWKNGWVQTYPVNFGSHTVVVGLEEAHSGVDFGNVESVYVGTYRTFTPESLGLALDLKGKHKPIPAIPTRTEFSISLTNGEGEFVKGAVVTFVAAIDPSTLSTMPSSVFQVLDARNRKFKFVFDTPLPDQSSILFHGFTTKYKGEGLGNFKWIDNEDSVRFPRTLSQTINQTARVPMPNALNVVEKVGATLRVGLGGPHSVVHLTYKDVLKSLVEGKDNRMHIGVPRCLDKYSNSSRSSIKRQQKYLTPTKHNNKLFSEAIALQTNIRGSDAGYLPPGFANLVFDDGTGAANPLNNYTIRQIAGLLDRFMSSYKDTTPAIPCTMPAELGAMTPNELFDNIRKIDSAFCGTMDTVSFGGGLVLKGVRPLTDVTYLRYDASRIEPVTFDPVSWLSREPQHFELYQNYPNPFNPTTTFSFYLTDPALVTLTIYNTLGQQVASVLNSQEMEDGSQDVEFDASNLPSGVYFYRLNVEGIPDEDGNIGQTFVGMKKMMLIK